jgi:uncharacterized cupredoxin-like copper-binding protein
MTSRSPLALMAASALVATALVACGDSSADPEGTTRTVEVDMVDIAFDPGRLEVDEGETVRFVFTNAGEVPHDAFIGDPGAQADHEDDMRSADEDEDGEHGGGHGDGSDDAVTVEPGDSAELTHTFDEAGTTEVGCHQEGHYGAGMKITVDVT